MSTLPCADNDKELPFTNIKIESGGIKNPTINTVQKIAKALGVGLEDLTK